MSNIYKGVHAPLISKELFRATQQAFKRYNKSKFRNHKFAFAGLITCGHCGCIITAEIKKGKYVYYHCSGAKGKCSENPWIREDKLDEMLAELIKPLQITEEICEWIKKALKESHEDEEAYHNQVLEDLKKNHKKLQDRIDRAYEDKLEGKISEEFWNRKSVEWQEEQEQILERIQKHQTANRSYLDLGISILELAKTLPNQYSKQNLHEKRKLLNLLQSNLTLKSGILYPVWRKPFDILLKMTDCQAG